MADEDDALARLKKSMAEVDGAAPAKMTADQNKKKARENEKLETEAKQRRIEKEAEAEDMQLRIRSRDVVLFQFYVDFISIAIIGLVFFFTCLSGLLNGVSHKMLSVRAIASVAIASIFVGICRSVISKLFHIKKERESEEAKKKKEGDDEGEKIDE